MSAGEQLCVDVLGSNSSVSLIILGTQRNLNGPISSPLAVPIPYSNAVSSQALGVGGGMSITLNANFSIANVTFSNNSATAGGERGSPTFQN